MINFKSDSECFEWMKRELYSAVIGDVLDLMGRRDQFLPPAVQPLRDDIVVAGRAMPVLEMDDIAEEGVSRKNPAISKEFGLMLEALDDLQENEVYICSGSSPTYALWGELMSTAAMNRGAAGAVMDGYSRDTGGILALGFPVFSHGRYARDQRPRGKVVDFRCSIKFGDVLVRPGDIVFGDLDGVVVIPKDVEKEVLQAAWDKANGEKTVFNAIKNGMGCVDAWDTYGIL